MDIQQIEKTGKQGHQLGFDFEGEVACSTDVVFEVVNILK